MAKSPGVSDSCPRCGASFHCGVNDVAPCACTAIALDAATLAALRQRYDSCLCIACLQALAALQREPMKKAGPV